MGTSTKGFRYPEATDRVADGATAIKNLASDVDAWLPTRTTWTPTLTGSTSNPGLGTGATREGYWAALGPSVVFVHIRFILGTGPTPGGGLYSIDLPFTIAGISGNGQALPGILHAGTSTNARLPVVALVQSNSISRVALPFYSATGPSYGNNWGTGAYAIGSGSTPALVAGDQIAFTGVLFR